MIYEEQDNGNRRQDKRQLNPDSSGNGLFAFGFHIIRDGGNHQNDGDNNEDDADDGFGNHHSLDSSNLKK